MSRLLVLGTAVAVAATSAALLAPGSAEAATKPVSTAFILKGDGYGARVVGGSIPAYSGDVANAPGGCVNKAPSSVQNHAAAVALPGGLGSIGAITSQTWTTKVGNTVNRFTRSKVASIKVGNDLGSLTIEGLTMTSHVWHSGNGFHAATNATAATVTGKIGPVELPGKLPTPSSPITIPGLLTLTMGAKSATTGANWAGANLDGLTLELTPTGTKVNLAHAWAYMERGAVSGIFGGQASGLTINALGGTVTSGGQPYLPMPCKSPMNKTLKKAVASVPLNIPGLPINVGAVTAQVQGNQRTGYAWGRVKTTVANVSLGGQNGLVIKGLVTEANAARRGAGLNTLVRNTNGTTVGSISVAGKSYTLSQLDGRSLKIPGLDQLVSIETQVVTRPGNGIQVIGLRLTIGAATPQTKSVVNLGIARVTIAKP